MFFLIDGVGAKITRRVIHTDMQNGEITYIYKQYTTVGREELCISERHIDFHEAAALQRGGVRLDIQHKN